MEDSELDSDIRMKTPDSRDGVTWGPRCCQVVFDNFDVKWACFHNIRRRAFSLLNAPTISFTLMILMHNVVAASFFPVQVSSIHLARDIEFSIFAEVERLV